MSIQSGRFRAARTIAPRYEDEVIGLPPAAMIITNSERRTAWCARRWYYSMALGLKSSGSLAMSIGRWTHVGLDAMYRYFMLADMPLPSDWKHSCPLCSVMDDVDPQFDGFRMYPSPPQGMRLPRATEPCVICGDTKRGIVDIAQHAMLDDVEGTDGAVEADAECDRLERMLGGYVLRYGAFPFENWRVVDVEVAIAAPIISAKSGKPYRSRVPVVRTDEGWRIARQGDDAVQLVSLPWYQVGRLDAVLQHRRTGDLLVHEFKTSGQPQSFVRDLHLDTQIPGYTRLLQHAVSIGKYCNPALKRNGSGEGYGADLVAVDDGAPNVQGYQYDVISSKGYATPSRLKTGKLSTASSKQARVPSWEWDRIVTDEDERQRHTDREWEAIKTLAVESRHTVDSKLYHREFGSFGSEMIKRYEVELFADAQRFAAMRRAGVDIDGNDESEIGLHFPRTPVCRIAGHGCAFTGPCLQDGDEIRQTFERRSSLIWQTAAGRRAAEQPTTDEGDFTCPF